jgi:hypothetical protein
MRPSHSQTRLLLGIAAATLAMTNGPLSAKSKRESREDSYGVIESRPNTGGVGRWVIGGRSYDADSSTEFHQEAGPLAAGSCAKVSVRNGRVHEIESERMSDCT